MANIVYKRKNEMHSNESKITFDDDATKLQIVKIQLLDMIKYACKCIENGVPTIEYGKIGKIFKIIHDES